MEPQDLGRVVTVSDPAVSPDGRSVAVVVGRVDVEANRGRSAIWLVPADRAGENGRPLTSGEHGDSQPRWSPDGTRLAFTRTTQSGDESRTSVLVLPMAGPGEPIMVATTTEAVTSLDWSPDGERLCWCARVPEVEPGTKDRDRPPRHITTLISRVDDVGWTVDRRSQVHVATADGNGEARAVTAGPFDHTEARWSPDGRSLVVVAARHDGWDLDEVIDLYLVDPGPSSGEPAEPRRITDGTLTWSSPSWSPDGERIAALAREVESGWHNTRPTVLTLETGSTVDVAPGVDRNFAPTPGERPPVWDGETVLVSMEDRGRTTLWRLAADGSSEPEAIVDGDLAVAGFDARNGVVATVITDALRPGELEVGGGRTTFCDEFLSQVPPLPAQRFTVPSPAGDGDIDVWLITPTGWTESPNTGGDGDTGGGGDSSSRWPLLLAVHGGPMTQYGDRWFDEFQLLAGAGYVVVASNPHGSSGRENSWQRAIRSPKAAIEPGTGWGGIDAEDLIAVLDATLARWPALDPDRVGVLGGSYGGFMTSWLLSRTDRFAAGCTERAVNVLYSEEWSSDYAGTFHRELGVSHLDDPDEYLRMSPATYVKDITAAVLILHSEQDLRCPPEQADALYVALRLLRHPALEYWRFPGEGHELSRSGSPKHRIRRAEIITAFFDRTIGPGPRPR